MNNKLSKILIVIAAAFVSGCGSTNGAAQSGSQSSSSEPLHFELPEGVLDYENYEYVGKGFYGSGDGDPTKTICLNFTYKNKENKQKNFQSDFRIQAYQNGTELSQPSGYSSSGMPESMSQAYDTVLQDGAITIGRAYVLQDYSPVTVIASHNGGKETSNQMVIEIEEYVDTSYDINKLYGYWEGKNGTALTITSSRITLNYSTTSSTYQDDPTLWTDETKLHTSLSAVNDLTIEDSDGTLRLSNDEYTFTQKENWPEGDGTSMELTSVSLGETISVDFAELVFDQKGIADELKYSNTTGGGQGYGGHITRTLIVEKAKTGTKYVYLQGSIRNTSSRAFDPENIKVKLVINDTYELEANATAVDAGSSVYELNPLNTCMVVLDAGIDTKTAGEIKKLDWYIGFDQAFSGGSSGDPEGSRYYYQVTVE